MIRSTAAGVWKGEKHVGWTFPCSSCGGSMREIKLSPRGENRMNKVTCGITMSLDAFVAGLNQSAEKPFGDIPETILHRWMFEEPEKHQAELQALTDAGAFIMGRNMYGP